MTPNDYIELKPDYSATVKITEAYIKGELERMSARMDTILEEMAQVESIDELTGLSRTYNEILLCSESLNAFRLMFITNKSELEHLNNVENSYRRRRAEIEETHRRLRVEISQK